MSLKFSANRTCKDLRRALPEIDCEDDEAKTLPLAAELIADKALANVDAEPPDATPGSVVVLTTPLVEMEEVDEPVCDPDKVEEDKEGRVDVSEGTGLSDDPDMLSNLTVHSSVKPHT
jgi:hypothetical protein